MKRITNININNFRVYQDESFLLEKGENLLVYGENGSGKSSLYRALRDFFRSSREQVPFNKNRHFLTQDGRVEVFFSEAQFINNQITILGGASDNFIFSSVSALCTSSGSNYIKAASLINGFLDYTDLLKVYLHDEQRPNLFQLIVLTLLGNHTPIGTGSTKPIKDDFNVIHSNLLNAYTRRNRTHQYAIAKLPAFEIRLRRYLDDIFKILNRYLNDYFTDFGLMLGYDLKPFIFHYGYYKRQWSLPQDLRLTVSHNTINISNNYSNVLNEARLSAIAVCLYLAALKKNATSVDFKMLFLDDVFIGLDSGNRLPILNILKDEFPEHQKIISTYDRQWFELAKRYFNKTEASKWQNIEMYANKDIGTSNAKPIIIKGTSYIERASSYLHHNTSPDYPAAANYLRKAIEELIKDNLPNEEIRDEDYMQIPSYKLGRLIARFSRFLTRIEESSIDIDIIDSLLHCVLHPLSHHEIDSHVYKSELLQIEKAYVNIKSNVPIKIAAGAYKCILEQEVLLRVYLVFDKYKHYYEIQLKENLFLFNNRITLAKCRLRKMKGFENGKEQTPFTPNNDDIRFAYDSLIDCLHKITFHIQQGIHPDLLMDVKPIDEYFEYLDPKTGLWEPLSGKL